MDFKKKAPILDGVGIKEADVKTKHNARVEKISKEVVIPEPTKEQIQSVIDAYYGNEIGGLISFAASVGITVEQVKAIRNELRLLDSVWGDTGVDEEAMVK